LLPTGLLGPSAQHHYVIIETHDVFIGVNAIFIGVNAIVTVDIPSGSRVLCTAGIEVAPRRDLESPAQ
jgi:hypothetical protein